MANYQTILVDNKDGVTTITLNRPEKRNAMSPQLHRDMYDCLTDLRYDKDTRVIIITGAGESFCAGQDLKQYFIEMDSQPERVRDEVREKSRQWRNEILRKMPQPVIAKINGWVFGGGFTVVTGCDIAIAADDVQLGLSEVNFGHFPGGEVTIVLSENLQPKHALYYALTGKTMTAKEAERIGLITKAVPRADLDKEVMDIANNLKEKAPSALNAVKEAWYYTFYSNPDVDYETTDLASYKAQAAIFIRSCLQQFARKEYRPGLGSYKVDKK
jgi:trans-feruloyl-CoA hydratase/vanillin synthase